jgi:hypothetical protein
MARVQDEGDAQASALPLLPIHQTLLEVLQMSAREIPRLIAKGVLLSARVWNAVARDLNTITQLSADSANAEKIAHRCRRVKRILQGKTPEPRSRAKGRRRRREKQ